MAMVMGDLANLFRDAMLDMESSSRARNEEDNSRPDEVLVTLDPETDVDEDKDGEDRRPRPSRATRTATGSDSKPAGTEGHGERLGVRHAVGDFHGSVAKVPGGGEVENLVMSPQASPE